MYSMMRALLVASFAFTNSYIFAQETLTEASQDVDIKKVSEAFGHFIGRNLKTSGLNFDIDSFTQGIKNGVEGKPAPLSDKEYEQQMAALQEQSFKRLAEDNLKAAEEFLKKNSNEKGIVVIEPGKLQYIIVKPGSGTEVGTHSSPQIQYTGKYLDGTVFGSSQDTGGPITIPVDQTIPGFSKGLQGMKEGEVRKIFVHPDLGYGKSGHLPPNSLLIFEVELIKADNPEHALPTSNGQLSLADDEDDSEDEIDAEEDDDAPAKKPKY